MSGITLDPLQVHANDLGETVGWFHGTPIVAWDPLDTYTRDIQDRHARILKAKKEKQ